MLAVAVIYSATSALGKIGVVQSSPIWFALLYSTLVTASALGLYLGARGREGLRQLAPQRWLVAAGASAGLMILLHFAAIERTQVAYMISVKRTSLLYTVLLGGAFFGEVGTGRRFAGALVMLLGLALLSLVA